jgi:hypothetical protein
MTNSGFTRVSVKTLGRNVPVEILPSESTQNIASDSDRMRADLNSLRSSRLLSNAALHNVDQIMEGVWLQQVMEETEFEGLGHDFLAAIAGEDDYSY